MQTVKVHNSMVEMYQQFLLKLVKAYENLGIDRPWTVFEKVFGTVKDVRGFIFIRPLDTWAELDNISAEQGLSEIMAKNYSEQEAMQWMNIVQKSVKSIETQVISQLPQFTQ